MSKIAKRHMSRVRGLPCVLCALLNLPQGSHTQAHHIRDGQGMSQRADDMLTVALCHECHQGPQGVHGDRTLLRIAKVTELGLLALTLEALA